MTHFVPLPKVIATSCQQAKKRVGCNGITTLHQSQVLVPCTDTQTKTLWPNTELSVQGSHLGRKNDLFLEFSWS